MRLYHQTGIHILVSILSYKSMKDSSHPLTRKTSADDLASVRPCARAVGRRPSICRTRCAARFSVEIFSKHSSSIIQTLTRKRSPIICLIEGCVSKTLRRALYDTNLQLCHQGLDCSEEYHSVFVRDRLIVEVLLQPLEQSVELFGLYHRPRHDGQVVPVKTRDKVRGLLHLHDLLELQLKPVLVSGQ
jgi:hypothetical protein